MVKKVLVYENGMPVRPTQKVKLDEGEAVIKEILDGFKILVQFDDPKVRPNFRELEPGAIGARVTEHELKKPPVGLRPRFIWISQRIEEINDAIKRYEADGYAVPRAWRSELAALQNSVFVPLEAGANLNDFAKNVQYQPAYDVGQLDQMTRDVLPFLNSLSHMDVEVIDNQLVDVSGNDRDILTAKFHPQKKDFAYLCAFLLNNARNILARNGSK